MPIRRVVYSRASSLPTSAIFWQEYAKYFRDILIEKQPGLLELLDKFNSSDLEKLPFYQNFAKLVDEFTIFLNENFNSNPEFIPLNSEFDLSSYYKDNGLIYIRDVPTYDFDSTFLSDLRSFVFILDIMGYKQEEVAGEYKPGIGVESWLDKLSPIYDLIEKIKSKQENKSSARNTQTNAGVTLPKYDATQTNILHDLLVLIKLKEFNTKVITLLSKSGFKNITVSEEFINKDSIVGSVGGKEHFKTIMNKFKEFAKGSEVSIDKLNHLNSVIEVCINEISNIKEVITLSADMHIFKAIFYSIEVLKKRISGSMFQRTRKSFIYDKTKKGGKLFKKSTIKKSRISNKILGGLQPSYLRYFRTGDFTTINGETKRRMTTDDTVFNAPILTINGLLAIGYTPLYLKNKKDDIHNEREKGRNALIFLKKIMLEYSKIHETPVTDSQVTEQAPPPEANGGMYINKFKNKKINTRKLKR